MSSCVGDPYYEQLNSAPTIKLSSLTDTIKVSPAAFTNQVSEIVTCYDYNMNMRTLTLTSSDQANIQIFDDKEAALSKTQIGNNVETLNQKVVFKAQKEGDYSVKFDVNDAFATSATTELKIHAFINLLPVAVIKSCSLSASTLSLDFTGSYDADAKWGGALKSYLVYLDGEAIIEVISPKVNIILSETQLPHIATTLNVAVRDNDSALSPKVKPTIQ